MSQPRARGGVDESVTEATAVAQPLVIATMAGTWLLAALLLWALLRPARAPNGVARSAALARPAHPGEVRRQPPSRRAAFAWIAGGTIAVLGMAGAAGVWQHARSQGGAVLMTYALHLVPSEEVRRSVHRRRATDALLGHARALGVAAAPGPATDERVVEVLARGADEATFASLKQRIAQDAEWGRALERSREVASCRAGGECGPGSRCNPFPAPIDVGGLRVTGVCESLASSGAPSADSARP
jgi:hypothetical protein